MFKSSHPRALLFAWITFISLGGVHVLHAECAAIYWNKDVSQSDCMYTKSGDSLYWRLPHYNDSHWKILRERSDFWVRNHSQGTGTRWYRLRIILPSNVEALVADGEDLLLYTASSSDAAEFYWNGQLVGENGSLDSAGNVTRFGKTSYLFPIPDSLVTPGAHILAIRETAKVPNSGYLSGIFLGKERDVFFFLHRHLALVILLCGGFWVAAAFHLAHFLTRFHRSPLMFAAMCGGAGILMMTPLAGMYRNISFENFPIIFLVTIAGWFLMGLSGLLYIMNEYSNLEKKDRAIISFVLFMPILFMWGIPFGHVSPQTARMLLISNEISAGLILLICTGICIYAIYKKITGAIVALGGFLFLSICLGAFFLSAPVWIWGLGMMGLILSLNLAQYLQFHYKKKSLRESELLQARLEIELLKKSIQPKFLINSLDAVSNWLERDPATASKMVNALADELRSMLKLVREKLISLEEELNICHSHLELMSFRMGCSHTLTVEGVKGNELIPPMIFYSLLEYGLNTHTGDCHPAVFKLTKKTNMGKEIYSLLIRGKRLNSLHHMDKTGILYVKARLREAFPSSSRFTMDRAKQGLLFQVEISRKN